MSNQNTPPGRTKIRRRRRTGRLSKVSAVSPTRRHRTITDWLQARGVTDCEAFCLDPNSSQAQLMVLAEVTMRWRYTVDPLGRCEQRSRSTHVCLNMYRNDWLVTPSA